MSAAETWQLENLSPAITPRTPSSHCSAFDVPSLSSCSSSTSYCSSLTTPERESATARYRPRGFMRPRATRFSDSARNRESVMNLGSIAHIQHYFARTGLLDTVGRQAMYNLQKEGEDMLSYADVLPGTPVDYYLSGKGRFRLHSNDISRRQPCRDKTISLRRGYDTFAQDFVLSPTTSTYRETRVQVAPLATVHTLRDELHDALADAASVLDGLLLQPSDETESLLHCPRLALSQGWYEIEGLHILDLVTLAIRAAKDYYMCHDRPERLWNIRPERQVRLDLYKVLDILKRVAARNFTGGYRQEEVSAIKDWILGVENILKEEVVAEKGEQSRRSHWSWLNGNWEGCDRYREWLFIRSFQSEFEQDPLPAWLEPTEDTDSSTSFLAKFRDGKRLIALHNAIIQSSSKRFGEITNFHLNTEKPYRKAENIKLWVKNAELRWDVKLVVNVAKLMLSDIDLETWISFDSALLKWCKAVRNEITDDCSGCKS